MVFQKTYFQFFWGSKENKIKERNELKMEELKKQKIWLCWNYIKDEYGKITKKPISYKNTATGTNEEYHKTWCTYENAKTAKEKYGFDGIGFVIPKGYWGADIDKRDFEDEITKDILILFYNTYTEKSPSGKGLHIIGKVDLTKIPKNVDGTKLNEKYYQKNPHNKIECYIGGLTNRFFTFTENVIVNKSINDCTEQLLTFLDKYMKKETKETTVIADSDILDMACADIIEIINKSEQAEKFTKLYFDGDISDYSDDDSSADMALCDILTFYCGEDFELIDKLFCGSKLYREKWNRLDYKQDTIKKAIALCKGKFYKNGVNFRMLEKLKKLTPEKRYAHNDIGMSELFADMFKKQLRYNTTAKQWYFYNSKVWQEDTGAMIAKQKIKELSKTLLAYITYIKDEDTKEKYSKYIKTLGNYNTRKKILEDSQSKMFISQTDFDKNKDLFNCQNGTLNLRTFKFINHNPDDLLSKISNVVYNPKAMCPQFKKFINEVMLHNKNKIDFLQKIFGYTLTAETLLEKCFILYGKTTRNGKGTLMDTILYMLGDYGMTAVPETLALKKLKDSSRASSDIARLNGCRFVNISEPSQQMVLDSALLKTLTGRDKITARFLNQNEFEFYPMFKLFINTNHLPIIDDDTVFKSGRINIITFDKHFNEDEQDKTLKDKLKAEDEISGIFNWCLEGLKNFREEGLTTPKEVETATDEYEKENNKIAKFFKQELVKNSKKNVAFKNVYDRYCEWCDKNNLPSLSKSEFMQYLKDKKLWQKQGTVNGKTIQNIVKGYDFKDKE